mmetsp:Transcript_1769/g.3705  ORF Transcript_1769/g.3705 Transcript_1769/m.3705 type:complete len:85 (+) Transcript_1769:2624-2878(+)
MCQVLGLSFYRKHDVGVVWWVEKNCSHWGGDDTWVRPSAATTCCPDVVAVAATRLTNLLGRRGHLAGPSMVIQCIESLSFIVHD